MEEALLLLSKFDGQEIVWLWEIFAFARKLGFSVKKTRMLIAWLFRHDYLEWHEYGKSVRILKHPELNFESFQTENYEHSEKFEYDGNLMVFLR